MYVCVEKASNLQTLLLVRKLVGTIGNYCETAALVHVEHMTVLTHLKYGLDKSTHSDSARKVSQNTHNYFVHVC